jgi:signal transduction histidine kinase
VHEQAGLPLHPEEIPLRAWMEQVRLEMEPLVLSRKQTLTLDLEPDLVLRADFQLMQRVVFNLVENASKFGPAGSDISIKAERTPTGLRLQVADLGVGIPAKLKGLVFERFSRLEKGASAPEGRGLGLAFCRLVVELHGGTIWVEENEPRGSRFLVELPG